MGLVHVEQDIDLGSKFKTPWDRERLEEGTRCDSYIWITAMEEHCHLQLHQMTVRALRAMKREASFDMTTASGQEGYHKRPVAMERG